MLPSHNYGKFFHYAFPQFSSFSCINKYMSIDSDRHLCMDSFRVLITAWLDSSQRSRDDVVGLGF